MGGWVGGPRWCKEVENKVLGGIVKGWMRNSLKRGENTGRLWSWGCLLL